MERQTNPSCLIFVISNPLQAATNLYKVGCQIGNVEILLEKYTPSIPYLTLYFSHPFFSDILVDIDIKIQHSLNEKSIIGSPGWYRCPLQEIIILILDCLESMKKKTIPRESVIFDEHYDTLDKDYIQDFIDECITKSSSDMSCTGYEIATCFKEWTQKYNYTKKCGDYLNYDGYKRFVVALNEKGLHSRDIVGSYTFKGITLKRL